MHFISEYEYLGVPLHRGLILSHLVLYLKEKTKSFSSKILNILHSVIGSDFASSMAIYGQLKQLSALYTSFTKKKHSIRSSRLPISRYLTSQSYNLLLSSLLTTSKKLQPHHTEIYFKSARLQNFK